MITFADLKTEKVPLPPKAEPKGKTEKAARVTLASKLNEVLPHVNDSTFIPDAKKVNVDQVVNKAKKDGKMSGAFKTVAVEVGEDKMHPDKAGVRIWRTEAGNVTQLAAAE